MKAVFDKKNKLCLGVVGHCPDGQEAGLVGYKQEEVYVREINEEDAKLIESSDTPHSFRNLRYKPKGYTLTQEEQPEVIQALSEVDKKLLFIFDKSKPLEDRFNALVDFTLGKRIRLLFKDEQNLESSDE